MNQLKYITVIVLFCFIGVNAQNNKPIKSNGTALVNIPITISSSAGSTNLSFGLDPTATDGIDGSLGETQLPPLPPSSVFDSRFVDDPNAEIPILENGISKDYRQGTSAFNGSKSHFIFCQVGSGTTFKVKWNLPVGVTGVLNDIITGTIVNKVMLGKDSATVSKTTNTLKMTINYALDSPAGYNITPSNLNPTAGSNLTISAQLIDAAGNAKAVSGKVVTWSKTGTGGSFLAATSTTDANGTATVTFTVNQTAGTIHTVTGTDNSTPTALTGTSANITVTAEAASKYIVSSSRTSVSAGDTVKITAQLADLYGNSVKTNGKTITWSYTGSGGSFASATSLTDANGKANVVFTTSSTIGIVHTVKAKDTDNIEGTSENITVTAGPPTKYIVISSRYSPVAGDTVKITAQLTDQFGNAIGTSGKIVTWSKTGTGGSFSAATSTTDANGKAIVVFTTSSSAPPITHIVTATDNNSLTGSTGNIVTSAGPATKYILTVSRNNPTVGDTVTIKAQLADTGGNPKNEAGKTVNWTSTNGGTFSNSASVTNANGIATIIFTVSQTSGTVHIVTGTDNSSLTGTSGDITTKADTATKYIVSVSKTNPVTEDTVKVKAQLVDKYNNQVSISGRVVTWSKSGSGGSFNPATSTTDANGNVATVFTVSSTPGITHVVTATDNSTITGSSTNIKTEINLKVPRNILSVTDTGGNMNLLEFGIDPNATDGIDSQLGEGELPPMPPAGIFDSRFVDDPNSAIQLLGNGISKDIRQGTSTLIGLKTHFIHVQVASGTTYKLKWNLPPGEMGLLNDIITGTLLNKVMVGKDSIVVNKSWNVLRMQITYLLGTIQTPALKSPLNNATDAIIPVKLVWNKAAFAEKYFVEVSASENFASVMWKDSTTVDTTKDFNASPLVKYYWRVRAKNSYALTPYSAYSTVWNFTTKISLPEKPVLVTPVNNATNISITPTLTWNASAYANTYRLQVFKDVDFTQIIFDDSTLTTTSKQIGPLAAITNYYWRVNAKNGSGKSAYSDVFKFTTELTLPPTPELVSPTNNATGQELTLTLKWKKSALTPFYKLVVANDASFNNIIFTDSTIVDTVKQITSLTSLTKYYWKVRGKNGAGVGSYSAVWNFTTKLTPPIKATLLTPANNSVDQSLLSTFSWNSISNADKYHLEISTNDQFSTIVYQVDTTTTSTKVPLLKIFTTYYWRIRGINSAGNGEYSDTWTFTTLNVTWNADLGVEDKSKTGSQVLVFGTASNATDLIDQIYGETPWPPTPPVGSFDAAFVMPNGEDKSIRDFRKDEQDSISWLINFQPGLSGYPMSFSWDPNQFPVKGGFYLNDEVTGTIVNVNMRKVTSYSLTKATIKSLIITYRKNVLPEVPVLATPVNNAVNQSINPTLTWNASLLADSYRLQAAKDANFTQIVFDDSTLTGTTKQIGTLLGLTKYYWRVNAKNVVGKSAYSDVFAFTTELTVPPTPKLVSPANNVIDQDLTLQLKWKKTFLATTYKLVVATDAGFANVILSDSTIADTTKQITTLTPLVKYYWKVRAKNDAGISAYSTAWNFTTKLVLPEKPVLVTPVNNAVNQSINPTLTWNAALYADSYRLQAAKDTSFTQLVFNDSTISGTTKQIGTLLGLTKYYWRVNAKNTVGKSVYSDVFAFTTQLTAPPTPELVSPANNVIDQDLTLQLMWKKTFLAATYKLVVATDAGFTNVILSDSTITDTVKQITTLTPLVKYYWKVRAKNDAGISTYSTVWNFKTKLVLPEKPVLVTPVNNAVNQSINSTLTWNASLYANTYRLQAAKDANFTQLVFDDSTLTGTSKQIGTLLGLTKYYWRVSAKNGAGKSAYSDVFAFTTELTAPPTPELVSPANNVTDQDLTLQLKWKKSFLATTYKLVVATDAGFTNVILSDSTVTDTVKQITMLTPLVKFYWKVRAKNDAGISSYSVVWNFTTKLVPPGKVTLSSPANNSVNQPLLLTLSWNSVSNADKYHLEVSTDNAFSTIVYQADTTVVSIKMPLLKIYTEYYWRIRGVNGAGNGEYSDIWSFKTLSVTWSLEINIQDKNNTGAGTLLLGAAPSATDGIDAAFGETSWPPMPPVGSFDAAFLLPGETERSIHDFRKDGQDSISWQIDFQPGTSGYPMAFSWDKAKLPEGSFTLLDAVTGTIVNVDMKSVSSYTLTNAGIKSLMIKYSKSISVPMNLAVGWNLMSLPVKMANMDSKVLFPEAVSLVYNYDGTYKSALTLENGKGYWVKYGIVSNKIFTGEKVNITSIPVKIGWNMIAVGNVEIQTQAITSNPANIVTSLYYEYKSSYASATKLTASKGYWVKVNSNGTLILPAASPALSKTAQNENEDIQEKTDGTSLKIMDATGRSAELELRKGVFNIEKYDMPPTPPNGEFDIRWQSDRQVEKAGDGSKEIVISYAKYPIEIHVAGGDLKIKDVVGGLVINRLVKQGEKITISNKEVERLLVEEVDIPTQYELSQNYPNPFNPETTIRYTIPASLNPSKGGTFVSLKVYDVLGREVETILDKVQEAGMYEIRWNASRIASGVYFYVLNAGSYKSIKKLVLIK